MRDVWDPSVCQLPRVRDQERSGESAMRQLFEADAQKEEANTDTDNRSKQVLCGLGFGGNSCCDDFDSGVVGSESLQIGPDLEYPRFR